MNDNDIEDFASRIAAAFEADQRPPQLSQELPGADLGLAYRVQRALVARLQKSRPLAGYKAGLTAPPAQAAYAVDAPVTGVLLQADFEPSARAFAPLAAGQMLLETEFAYRVARPIDGPLEPADLPACIAGCMAAVEVVQDRLHPRKVTVADLVANNVNARGYLLGEEVPFQRGAINSREVALIHGDRELHRAPAGSVQGDQFVALCWLINRIIERGYRIEPGNILLTGAIGGIQPGEPGNYRAQHGADAELDFDVIGG